MITTLLGKLMLKEMIMERVLTYNFPSLRCVL